MWSVTYLINDGVPPSPEVDHPQAIGVLGTPRPGLRTEVHDCFPDLEACKLDLKKVKQRPEFESGRAFLMNATAQDAKGRRHLLYSKDVLPR